MTPAARAKANARVERAREARLRLRRAGALLTQAGRRTSEAAMLWRAVAGLAEAGAALAILTRHHRARQVALRARREKRLTKATLGALAPRR